MKELVSNNEIMCTVAGSHRFRSRIWVGLIPVLLAWCIPSLARNNVGCALQGTQSVKAFSVNTYSLNGTLCTDAASWSISCGSIMLDTDGPTSISVYFSDPGCSSAVIKALNSSGGVIASITVTISGTVTFNAGYVDPSTQQIDYYTQPEEITASYPSFGGCESFTYQWYQSTDNVNFTAISGAISSSYQPGTLIQTTYYKRRVSCSGYSGTTDVATVTVSAPLPLTAGTITTSSSTIYVGDAVGQISATVATQGTCAGNYVYMWQQSTDGESYTDTGNSGQNFTPSALYVTTWFRRKVTCDSETAYTSSIIITVQFNPLTAGAITTSDFTVNEGDAVTQISATVATQGNCNGNYIYTWQQSTDGTTYSDTGGSSQNFTPDALHAKTWFRRKVTCGSEIAYTNSIIISVLLAPNYIRVRTMTKEGILTKTDADAMTDVNTVTQTTQYIDGLGRPLQEVIQQGSPAKKDEVTIHLYDTYGNEPLHYLPYVATSGIGEYKTKGASEQSSYNATLFSTENSFYEKTVLESSPLNRPVATYAPGKSWAGNQVGIVKQYQVNIASDNVLRWSIDDATGQISAAGVYEQGQLFKNVSVDEQTHQVIEFVNKEKQVVLKKIQVDVNNTIWACTYYIYDDNGNLVTVLPPEAVEKMKTTLGLN